MSLMVVKKDFSKLAWLHLSDGIFAFQYFTVHYCFSEVLIFAIVCLPSLVHNFIKKILKYFSLLDMVDVNKILLLIMFHVFFSHHHESGISVCLADKFSEIFSLHHHATAY